MLNFRAYNHIFLFYFPDLVDFVVLALTLNLAPDVRLTSTHSFSRHQWKEWYEVLLGPSKYRGDGIIVGTN